MTFIRVLALFGFFFIASALAGGNATRFQEVLAAILITCDGLLYGIQLHDDYCGKSD